MKQFYYGNVFEENGYRILDKSPGIPEIVLSKMEKCAVPYSILNTENSSEIGLINIKEGTIFFCTSIVKSKTEKGENRPTYFMHAYFISQNEKDIFTENMAEVIRNTRFQSNYSEKYDVSELQMDISKAEEAEEILSDDLIDETMSNSKMIFYKKGMDTETALEIMAEIAENTSYEQRKNITFISMADKPSERTDALKFIFCDASDIKNFRRHYISNCKYFNIDNMKVFNVDKAKNVLILYKDENNEEEENQEVIVDNEFSLKEQLEKAENKNRKLKEHNRKLIRIIKKNQKVIDFMRTGLIITCSILIATVSALIYFYKFTKVDNDFKGKDEVSELIEKAVRINRLEKEASEASTSEQELSEGESGQSEDISVSDENISNQEGSEQEGNEQEATTVAGQED